MPPLLELTDITKKFPLGRQQASILDSVSLSVKAGELVAIVGPSGSGKTTLAHIMGGLMKPTSGHVSFEGQLLRYSSDKKISQYRNTSVGFVFQNYNLIPYYSALENVMMPLVVAKLTSSERKAQAKHYLSLVGLEKYVHQSADTLSGGQRQRVGIARALVTNPKLIIADEPTGNLDTKNGLAIMHILKQLCYKKNITVLMVTHNDDLAHQADRIIHIKDGHIQGDSHA